MIGQSGRRSPGSTPTRDAALKGAPAAMQNMNLWLAVDRLRAVADADPESARELADLIALIQELDGTHDSAAAPAG